MKTYLKSILAIIMIAFCACEKDPTFSALSINDNATKVSNVTTTLAKVTISIIETESGDHYNYNRKTLEVYYSTSSNPFIDINSHKCWCCSTNTPITYTATLSNLEPGTTYYYAPKFGNQKGKVGSFKTKSTTPDQGKENGHEWVDLGLSVKWATCNVGATTPEGYGDYFAWGETSPKADYSWSTYKWCQGSEYTLTKYCTSSEYGTVDLELTDDAAHVNWGGNWRMPTKAEIDELRNNCTWTWTTQNGVKGYQVRGKNGNSIFLPAAGGYSGVVLGAIASYGYYWSSSRCVVFKSSAYDISFTSYGVDNPYESRCYGSSIRAVCPYND